MCRCQWDVDNTGKAEVKHTVYLHPVLAYFPERYAKDVIGHEMDHLEVDRKRYANLLRTFWRLPKKELL